jgi:hypothetical protein
MELEMELEMELDRNLLRSNCPSAFSLSRTDSVNMQRFSSPVPSNGKSVS